MGLGYRKENIIMLACGTLDSRQCYILRSSPEFVEDLLS